MKTSENDFGLPVHADDAGFVVFEVKLRVRLQLVENRRWEHGTGTGRLLEVFTSRHCLEIYHHCVEQVQELLQVDHLDLRDFSRVGVDGDASNLDCRLPDEFYVRILLNSEDHLVAILVDTLS